MTEKEQEYRKQFRDIGKHLHKNDFLPINLANHPTTFTIIIAGQGKREVKVDWGWASRDERGRLYIPFDIEGKPHPYEGFWEARCCGSGIR